MTIRPATILCLLAAALPGATQQPQTPPDPVLVSLRTWLERELQELKPAPAFEIPASSAGKSLVMRYRTREYQVSLSLRCLGATFSEHRIADQGLNGARQV